MNIYKISKKEFLFNIYNYWFLFSALIFVLLNFLVIYFSEFLSGDYSQTDIRALSLSIIHLQMYLIPLISFILSYDSILSEKETGMLDLLLSYRINFLDILLGKLIGNSFLFTLSFFIGFLPIIFYLNFLGINLILLNKFLLISIWLNIIFNAMAIYISNLSKDRTIIILLSIFIWLFFIFIYDIFFTFTAVFFHGIILPDILNFLLFLNPIEIFRILSIFYFNPDEIYNSFGFNLKYLNIFYINIFAVSWLFFSFYLLFLIRFKNK